MGPPLPLLLPPFVGDGGPDSPTLLPSSTLPFFGDPPLGDGSGADDDAPLSALSVLALLSLLLLLSEVDTTVGAGGGIRVRRGYRAEQHPPAMCVAAGWEGSSLDVVGYEYEYFSSVRNPGPPHVQGDGMEA